MQDSIPESSEITIVVSISFKNFDFVIAAFCKSFAFRIGRSMQDANEYLKDAIRPQKIQKVIITDVKACYQSISHEWLLNNIPMDRRVLKEFLNAGYIFDGELFPTDDYGISLGCNISPKLNSKLTGWASYHKVSNAFMAFRRIDVFVKANLIKLCEMKHPAWSIEKIRNKYWYPDFDGQYVYALKDKSDVRVKRLADTVIIEHKKIT